MDPLNVATVGDARVSHSSSFTVTLDLQPPVVAVPSVHVAAAPLKPPPASFSLERRGRDYLGSLRRRRLLGHVSCHSRASWEKIKRKDNQTTSTSLVLLPRQCGFRLFLAVFPSSALKIHRLVLVKAKQQQPSILA